MEKLTEQQIEELRLSFKLLYEMVYTRWYGEWQYEAMNNQKERMTEVYNKIKDK